MSSKSRPPGAPEQAHLKLEGQKELVMDFGGGLLSHFGGLPLPSRLEEQERLIARAAEIVPEWRKQPELATFTKERLLKQRTLLTMCGYAGAIDCSIFKDDPGLKTVLGGAPDGRSEGSQSTQTRMEQSMTPEAVKQMEGIFWEHFVESQVHAPRELTVSVDGTWVKTYGAQGRSVYKGGDKYKSKGYFPLIATTDCGWLLRAQLREGSASDAKALPDIRELVDQIKETYPSTKLKLKIDTGFNSPELLEFLDCEGVEYLCGYPFTSAIATLVQADLCKVERQFEIIHGKPRYLGKDGKEALQKEHKRIRELPADKRMKEEQKLESRRVREIVEVQHLGTDWPYERRVIVRIDYTDKGFDVRCVVTNKKHGLPRWIYDDYCKRSRIEPMIDQVKNHCRVPLSAQEFTSNQFRFLIQGIAYQLLQLLRRFLPVPHYFKTISSLRKTLLLIPVRIEETARRIYWRLSSSSANQTLFLRLVEKLNRLSA